MEQRHFNIPSSSNDGSISPMSSVPDVLPNGKHTVAFSKSNNSQQLIQRGDELLQIHFDGHTRTSADELYHAIWETYSDNVSIQSPISGKIGIVGDDTDTDTTKNINNIDTIFKSIEQDGIDEETVLIEITTTEEEWKHACQQENSDFVNETEYLKIIQNIPRGSFYDGE